jgi:hypothetical protein
MTSRRSEGCRNRILYAELQHTSLRKVGNVAYWLEEDRFCNLGLGTTEPSRWLVRPAMTEGGIPGQARNDSEANPEWLEDRARNDWKVKPGMTGKTMKRD